MFCSNSAHHDVSTDPKRLKKAVQRVCRKIRALNKVTPIDAIVYCGSSGAAVAYPASVATGIPVVNVRKKNELTHGREIEGKYGLVLKNVVIVDDFIAEGCTMCYIIHKLGLDVNYVGVILYFDSYWNTKNYSKEQFKKHVSYLKDMPVYTVG